MAIRIADTDAVIYEIPKTGTTFVRQVLKTLAIPYTDETPIVDCCPRHAPWWCYPPASRRYCIVRHPLPWYESFSKFHFPSRIKFVTGRWYPWKQLHPDGMDLSFGQWIDRVTFTHPGIYTRLVEAFCGPLEYEAMDMVLRTETLAQDLVAVLMSLGFDFDPDDIINHPHINVSEGNRQWTQQQKDRVMKLELPTLRRYYESS